jgi:hypothetical protein
MDAQTTESSEPLRSEVDSLRRDLDDVKDQVEKLTKTLSRFVVSERKEKYYQAILEKEFQAGHLRIVRVGETDITTEDSHIEIKRWSDSDKVMGQLRRYQRSVKKARLCAYFFGRRPKAEKVQMIYELLHEAGIEMYSFNSDDTVEKHGDERDDADQEAVKAFIATEMVRTNDPTAILHWMDFKNAFMSKTKLRLKRADLRERLGREGLKYAESSINGTRFMGFLGWSVRSAEDQPSSDTTAGSGC